MTLFAMITFVNAHPLNSQHPHSSWIVHLLHYSPNTHHITAIGNSEEASRLLNVLFLSIGLGGMAAYPRAIAVVFRAKPTMSIPRENILLE